MNDSYRQGYDAGYHRGATPDENPYEFEARQDYVEWEVGRIDGRDDWRHGVAYAPGPHYGA